MTATRRWPAAVLVGALAAAFVAGVLTGRAPLFVRPWFTPVMATTGLVLAGVALRAGQRVRAEIAALVLVPVVVALALPAGVVGRAASTTASASDIGARLGDGDNPVLAGRRPDVTLLDIVLAERKVGGVYLAGRPVVVEAMVGPGPVLTRSVMVCCAADARPVSVPVRGAAVPAVSTWVRVRGRLAAEGNRLVVQADRVERIGTPSRPLL